VKIEDFIARRTKMAETRIAQAEAQAVADVRAAAADVAIAAAEAMLIKTTHGAAAEALLTQSIGDLKAKLN
jgi:F-type H+-transporting ATPase subunit b